MRFTLALPAAAAAMLVTLAFAGAARSITNGIPDGNAHPEVGVLVSEFRGGIHFSCSGTLISPTVFLLAAHCDWTLYGIQPTATWVDFNPDADPFDVPPADLHPGTFIRDPLFQPNAGGKDAGIDTHDIAVVVLDSPVTDVTPATLPPAGLLDQMAAQGGLQGQTFTNVGYGFTGWNLGGGTPTPQFPQGRAQSTSTFMALENAYIRNSENQATGNGGTCNLDSGGPQFLPGTTDRRRR